MGSFAHLPCTILDTRPMLYNLLHSSLIVHPSTLFPMTTEQLKKYKDLIDEIDIAMLVTRETDSDKLRSRPMAVSQVDEDGAVWFFTKTTSGKVDEVSHYREVNLSFAKPDRNSYLSVTGTAYLNQDKRLIDELWSKMLEAWFPKGKDDPELGLLKVVPEEAEYWDSTTSKMVQLFHIGKALATDSRYDEGKHEKLE